MSTRIIRVSFIFFSFIFFTPVLHAKIIKANYSVEFGVFGEVASAHATLTSNAKSYTIDATVLVAGAIAKAVTDDLRERHVSKGRVLKGLLVTDMYQMIKSYGEYSSTTIYRTDHRKKRVTRHYIKWKNRKEVMNEKVTLGYYGRDDMMTFFMNLPKYIKEKYKSRNYKSSVVGADRKNGRVDIIIPSQNTLKQMSKFIGTGKKGDWYSKVVMHRKLYNSEKGELEVRMGKDGLVEKAVLKDLIFFGDVRIIRQ